MSCRKNGDRRRRSFTDAHRRPVSAASRCTLALAALFLLGCGGGDVLELAGGGRTAWQDYDGKWLLVNYWAEWCSPCRREIPELNEIQTAGVAVLGVNFDELQGADLDASIDALGIRFPVALADPRERWGADRPEVLPTTLVIAPDGRLHDVLVGPQDRVTLAVAMAR